MNLKSLTVFGAGPFRAKPCTFDFTEGCNFYVIAGTMPGVGKTTMLWALFAALSVQRKKFYANSMHSGNSSPVAAKWLRDNYGGHARLDVTLDSSEELSVLVGPCPGDPPPLAVRSFHDHIGYHYTSWSDEADAALGDATGPCRILMFGEERVTFTEVAISSYSNRHDHLDLGPSFKRGNLRDSTFEDAFSRLEEEDQQRVLDGLNGYMLYFFEDELQTFGKKLIVQDGKLAVRVKFEGSPSVVLPISKLSRGERAFALIIGGILANLGDTSSDLFVLIDGVETYLHPSEQRAILWALKRIVKQHPRLKVVLTTNSTDVVSMFDVHREEEGVVKDGYILDANDLIGLVKGEKSSEQVA